MGDRDDEFGTALVALLPRARRFALGVTGSASDADDLVQAGMERALRGKASWTKGTRLDSWLFKIMQNLWRDELRAHRRRAEPLEHAADIVGEDGRDLARDRLRASEVGAALAALSEEQRAVVAAVIISGLTYQEAAKLLNVPVGTIMSRLARARATLIDILVPDNGKSDLQ